MLAAEREQLILEILRERGFIRFQELDRRIRTSHATLRRDLDRLEREGKIARVHGGAPLVRHDSSNGLAPVAMTFADRGRHHHEEMESIGRTAARLCGTGESVILDGGTATLAMCRFVEALQLHVMTNSLNVVGALLLQSRTQVTVPAGTLFREQGLILSPFDDGGTERFRASKLFVSTVSVGPHGLMQRDVLLVQATRRFMARADALVVLADSGKFVTPAGHAVCGLEEIDILVTDGAVADAHAAMLENAGVKVLVAE